MSAIEDRYARIADGFGARVAAVDPAHWGEPSPCREWTARDIVVHIVDSQRALVAQVAGEEPQPVGADEDPVAAWTDVRSAVQGLLADPALSVRQINGPTGPAPVESVVDQFVRIDLLIHTWDLARSVGADERLDESAVTEVYETLKPMDAMLRGPGVFGPRLDAPSGADRQTEFLAFVGRRA